MKRPLPKNSLFWSFLLLGAAIRLYAAWLYRHTINLDAGVVALMAKHIAEGRDYPIFFYGQPHMGSLEAFCSAFFIKLLGANGFAVNLGTAFISFWILPIVYKWGKLASNQRAGLFAMAFCLIGPFSFFHYNGSPRGGYAAALTFGAFLLMKATEMALKWKQEKHQRHLDFFILGLAAGLAWWSSQLTTAAILVAALLLLISLGIHAFSLRIFNGLFGFILGSFPLWLYNLQHQWATFRFTNSMGQTRYFRALKWFYTDRFSLLFFPSNAPPILNLFLSLLYLSFVSLGIALLVYAGKKKKEALFWNLLGIYLFTLTFSALFASSHLSILATPRYSLPLVAPLAVLIAICLTQLPPRISHWVASIPLLFLIAVQCPTLFDRSTERAHAYLYEQVQQLGQTARSHHLNIIYAPVDFRSWNFILQEEFIFSNLKGEVYPPYAQQAELAALEDLSVLDDYGDLSDFLTRTSRSVRNIHTPGHDLSTEFTPPLPQKILRPDIIQRIQDQQGREWTQALTSTSKTENFSDQPGTSWQQLTIELKEETPLSGLRLWPENAMTLPDQVTLEGKTVSGQWISLTAQTGKNEYFWSGNRFFWGSPFYRLQFHFPTQSFTSLRLQYKGDDIHNWAVFKHLDLLSPLHDSPDPSNSLPQLFQILNQRNIQNLYADRWESTQIFKASYGKIATALPADLFEHSLDITLPDLPFDPTYAILSSASDAWQTREVLLKSQAAFEEKIIGPWTLFTSTQTQTLTGLSWNGSFLFEHPARQAQVLWENGDQSTAIAINPHLAQPPHPDTSTPVIFKNGIQLLGLESSPLSLKAGESFSLNLLWKIPENIPAKEYAVFAHFKQAQHMFTGDHVLLDTVADTFLSYPADHRQFSESYRITVPSDSPAGTYTLWLGLYNRASNKRLPPQSEFKTKDRAVALPVSITIQPAS
ncbi:hypothetical protein P3T73_16570 [Kiritimatiellota bacterium B12222]|nr:hypothetical protein P3T73_16570 [Kiritimatiellota bacterium B12222]